jgi:GT2 family glycosyltransferase
MKIGFVCTNYNNSSYTREAITSLRAGSRWEDVQVVVVDNRSNEGDVAALKAMGRDFPGVELIFNPENVGYFPGLNIGIRHLRRTFPGIDHVVVGNNDLVFPPTFVETVQRHREVFDQWAVVAPDLVTLDGVHQNPHVVHPFGAFRRFIWDIHYFSYPTALLVLRAAKVVGSLMVRPERAPTSELFKQPGPIMIGFGACYLLGPRFFQHFSGLCAPTFLMVEEWFLSEQLKLIGQMPYYDPRFVIMHHDHATTDKLPGRRHWQLSRDGYRVYKRYLAMTHDEQGRFLADHIGATA